MSVATKNPFALLDAEDSSPADSPAPAAPAVAAAPAPTRGTPKTRGGSAVRGGKYYQRGGGAPKAPRENGAEEFPAGGDRPKRTFDGEGRPEGRGRGRGGRGGRGGGRGDRGGDRSERGGGRLDRHSATGKTDSDKKVHQSWGGDDGNTELKVEEAATVDAAAEGATGNEWGAEATAADDAWGAPAATADDAWAIPATSSDEPVIPAAGAEGVKNEGRRAREREQEEEDNTLTFDQYLAQKAEKEASLLPKLEARKANEGADDSLWKDAVQVQKGEDEEAYFATKRKSAPKARTEKKEKVFLEIEARFERPDRGGRGGRARGDRGERGSRPGRGRGGDDGARRGGRSYGPQAVNVDDEKAFPSLT